MRHLYCLILLLLGVSGCSTTETFMRPISDVGFTSTVNPSCPGVSEVLNLTAQDQWWAPIRVYATDAYSIQGMELRIHAGIEYRGPLRPQKYAGKKIRELIQKTSGIKHTVEASSPYVTVQIPNKKDKKYFVPLFAQPYVIEDNGIGRWDSGILISEGIIDNFTVLLPEITINGEKVRVSSILFSKSKEKYTWVLNC